MADRFPLILNTNANQIQEIASGDTLDLTGNNVNNAGVITATSFSGPVVAGAGVSNITAGIGTYTDLRVGGDTSFSEDLVVTGNARVTGILTVGTSSIILNDSTNTIKVGTALTLGHTQGLQFHTQNLHSAGFEVNQINASGIITATEADINGDLDVDGHTNLDNVSVGGATTTSGVLVVNASTESTSTTTGALRVAGGVGIVKNLYVGGILDSDGPTHLDYVSVAGVTTHSDTVHIIDDKVLMFGSGGDSTIEYDENGTDQLTIAGAVTRFTNTTQSTSKDTGSVIFEGGLGVEKNLSVGGNVSVGGVLTYEDVTNVDSIGIVTARQGIRLGVDGTSSANYISVGVGNDLKIWHQSSNNHSYISETGSGSLVVLADDFYVQDTSTNTMISAKEGAEVNLHFNGGTPKLSTTNTGVTVTGTASATTFSGSGASLTNLPAAQLSGTAAAIDGSNITNLTSANLTGALPAISGASLIGVLKNVVDDSTPELGGNLQTNGNNIQVGDNDNLNFGASSDLYIKHSSGHNANFIVSYQGDIEHHMTLSKKIIKGFQNSGTPYVSLYQDGNEKLRTRSTGVAVFDTLSVGTSGLQASNCLSIVGNTQNQVNIADGSNSSWGLLLTQSQAGGGYHTTTNSSVNKPCAIVNVNADALNFGTSNTMRWTIDHSGHLYPGGNGNLDIGKTANRVRNLYTSDLHLSNEAKGANDVDGTWGDFTIQEGESDLFLINNRSGKKYKFNLTEVS